MYFCLQYFLDELMYSEVKNINKFYIEDNEYNISKLYFGQEEWIIDIYVQKFTFYSEKDLNINEAMYLMCYLKEYDNCLLEIEEFIKPIKTIPKIKRRIRDTIQRIRLRHSNIWTVLSNIINNDIDMNPIDMYMSYTPNSPINTVNALRRQNTNTSNISTSPSTPIHTFNRQNISNISTISNTPNVSAISNTFISTSNEYYISS
jgi:hypothetical protein